MKLDFSKALFIGGIYSILETPLYFIGTQFTDKLEYFIGVLFFINLLLLCVPRFYSFINKYMQNYPRITYYFTSIGLVIYFMLIGFIVVPFLENWGNQNSYMMEMIKDILSLVIFTIIGKWGVLISLILAFGNKKNDKFIWRTFLLFWNMFALIGLCVVIYFSYIIVVY